MRCKLAFALALLLAMGFVATAAPVEGASPSDQPVVHVVREGETLWTIAAHYGVTVEAICRANGIDDCNWIYVGQQLTIPLDETPELLNYIVKRGDTLETIASRYGTTVQAIVQANEIEDADFIYPGQRLLIPSSSHPAVVHYAVREGDTLSSIAARFGTTVQAIADLNGLADPSLIYTGQRLAIPTFSYGRKRIEIDISAQRLIAWQGNSILYRFVVSTGLWDSTRCGHFQILDKIPMAYSRSWNLWMPFWMGIYWVEGSENGIHALPIINGKRLWRGYLGRPISYGCVVLDTPDAETLYNWADIGTPVVIHK